MKKYQNQKIKQAVHARDNYCCVRCGMTSNLHAHHVLAEQDLGEYEMDNLISLCEGCHKEWHFAEQVSTIPFDLFLKSPPYIMLFCAWQILKTKELSDTMEVVLRVRDKSLIISGLFFEGDGEPEISYADRKGKYQAQTGITLAKV